MDISDIERGIWRSAVTARHNFNSVPRALISILYNVYYATYMYIHCTVHVQYTVHYTLYMYMYMYIHEHVHVFPSQPNARRVHTRAIIQNIYCPNLIINTDKGKGLYWGRWGCLRSSETVELPIGRKKCFTWHGEGVVVMPVEEIIMPHTHFLGQVKPSSFLHG